MADSRHAQLRKDLLRWFHRNAKSLPWRGQPSAYAVWISEIMLQQTQVATVIPYYERFLAEFPTLANLAAAPLERVLELWSGLGYYRRARNMHQAGQKIVAEFAGKFPANYDQARGLPGIGDYTARAVLSIAFNQPYAVLDGNVARVVARLFALDGQVNQPAFRHVVEQRLEELLSRRRPGDFNQAMMELGQTVCLPKAPHCTACPLKRSCEARRLSQPEAYPQPRPRRATEVQHLATAVIRARPDSQVQAERFALVRGLDQGLLGDLWNFPAAFGSTCAEALARLEEKLEDLGVVDRQNAGSSKRRAGSSRRVAEGGAQKALRRRRKAKRDPQMQVPFAELRHGITYRSIKVDLYACQAPAGLNSHPGGSWRWFRLEEISGAGAAVSQLARKIAGKISADSGAKPNS